MDTNTDILADEQTQKHTNSQMDKIRPSLTRMQVKRISLADIDKFRATNNIESKYLFLGAGLFYGPSLSSFLISNYPALDGRDMGVSGARKSLGALQSWRTWKY